MDLALRLEPGGLSRLCAADGCKQMEESALFGGRRGPQADAHTRCYVDTGPLVERVYAKYAGVGWIGKIPASSIRRLARGFFWARSSLLLNFDPICPPSIAAALARAASMPARPMRFIAPYQLDSNQCISYLTIEKRGSIPEDMRAGIGPACFRLRHLPGCLPVEPQSAGSDRDRVPSRARPGESCAGVACRNVCGGISRNFSRIAHPPHQALRPAPQCRHRHGKQRKSGIPAPARTNGD